jgi:hypothetical protein
MNQTNTFPIPFRSLRVIGGGGDRPFVVGAMFTAGYADKAKRLAASCEQFRLPYVIHEVPTVHCSISRLGADNLSYTKPNFIRYLLAAHKKPVLYVDADCELKSQPVLIDALLRQGVDFAIYNWYADEYTDRFMPVAVRLDANEPLVEKRFYRFAGSVDWFTERQLACSGIVQLYNNSVAARALLERWHRTIESFHGCADDAALAFTFNNLTRRSWLWWLLRARWLPKPYARFAFWIHTNPVINHPDFPAGDSGFTPIEDPKGRKVVYHALMELKDLAPIFPRDCIIDTERHLLCRYRDGQLESFAPTNQELWL